MLTSSQPPSSSPAVAYTTLSKVSSSRTTTSGCSICENIRNGSGDKRVDAHTPPPAFRAEGRGRGDASIAAVVGHLRQDLGGPNGALPATPVPQALDDLISFRAHRIWSHLLRGRLQDQEPTQHKGRKAAYYAT